MAQATRSTTRQASSDGGIKETIESILIAFILAFIFRGFVVEAFVIPTGSMAPTLYGAHMRLQCPDCGYTWEVNYSASQSGDDMTVPSDDRRKIVYHCPNCGYPLPQGEENPVRFGDRILVLKYLYLFESPRRWDVVVFKSPEEREGHRDPADPEYGENYIKRLVGKPRESVMILDGDVYIGPEDATTETPEKFKIQRKPRDAQEALWRTVFDNDYVPSAKPLDRGPTEQPYRRPWTSESESAGWNLNGINQNPRIFEFSNPKSGGAIYFNADANPRTNDLTDYLGYDELFHQDTGGWSTRNVSDLKLSCFYQRHAGDGPLEMQLTKLDKAFTARFTPKGVELLEGTITSTDLPLKITNQHVIRQLAAAPGLSGAGPVKLELLNVDHRVTVRVNGQEALSPFEYDPDVRALLAAYQVEGRLSATRDPLARPVVRITAQRQSATLEHLLLARDVYYLNKNSRNPNLWATPDHLTHLGADEYFVLGDNSFISSDARFWNNPIDLPYENLHVESGRVPGRFMLGKAFFVYWPAGFRPPGVGLNIIPDFAEMRFIH